jgi:CubicO group peptidase (beta-lactamase class C family)
MRNDPMRGKRAPATEQSDGGPEGGGALDRRRFLHVLGGGSLALGAVGMRSDAPPLGAGPSARSPFDDNDAVQEDPRLQQTYRLIESKMAEYRVPGVAFGLVTGDDVHLRGFGITNVDNPQPVDPDTVFPIASISKTVVATAMMSLVDDGRIDLEAPVRAYLPAFRVADATASGEVRVWHLLTHTPGWEGQLGTPDRGPRTLERFVEGLAELPQLARPGEVWSYNNAGFGVAGRILEVVHGSSINDALDELVFEPLTLDRAFSRTGTAMTYRFAAPHRESDGRTAIVRPFRLPANVSAGGTAMSVASLIRYARFHLGHPIPDADLGIVSPSGRTSMRTARITKNATTDEMGHGWHLRTLDGVVTAAHGGTLAGHCLHVQLVPERDFSFAILTNHNQGWRLIHDLEQSVLDRFLGLRLAPGQRTGGNRGGNEMMTTHARALASQPAPVDYTGTYRRPPVGESVVALVGSGLVLRGSGSGGGEVPLVFWGEDVAYTDPQDGRGYPYRGMPVEFVRDDSGVVRWVRVNGRIARKD